MTEKSKKNHFGAKIAERIAREQEQEQQSILTYPEVEEPERKEPRWLAGHSRGDDWNPWCGD